MDLIHSRWEYSCQNLCGWSRVSHAYGPSSFAHLAVHSEPIRWSAKGMTLEGRDKESSLFGIGWWQGGWGTSRWRPLEDIKDEVGSFEEIAVLEWCVSHYGTGWNCRNGWKHPESGKKEKPRWMMSLSTSWLCYVIYQLPPALGSMSSLPCRAVSSPTVNQYKLFLLQAIAHQLFGCINQKSNHYTRNSHPDWKKQTLRRRQQQGSVTGENHRENTGRRGHVLGEGTQCSVKCQKLKSESILMMSAGKADGKMGRWLLHYGVYTGTEAGEEGSQKTS